MRLLHFSASSRGKWGFPSRGGWPRLLISLASPTRWGSPSFAFLAKGGYHDRIRNGVCAERTKVASAASLPALAKNARTTDSSDEAKKNGGAVDFRSAERLSDNRTMSYGSESQETRRNG